MAVLHFRPNYEEWGSKFYIFAQNYEKWGSKIAKLSKFQKKGVWILQFSKKRGGGLNSTAGWERGLHRGAFLVIVRRAGLLWSQQDFEWRWSVPLFKCLTVLEFSFILFDLCLLITFFNFIMNYVPIVTFWIFTYHKIWILSIMFCFIWSYWIIYFLACLEVSWRVVS